MPEIGIICGMAREALALGPLAGHPAVAIAISGARPDRAEAEALRLAGSGCRALVSWGIAGGLDPELPPGALLTPGLVIDQDGQRMQLHPDMIGASPGAAILGLDEMVMSVRAKAALAETGAVAVDMETHRVARAGLEAEIPVVAIRAVGDPAGRALPQLVASALGDDGRPRIGAVIWGLIRRPKDLPALVKVKQDTDLALAALLSSAPKLSDALISDARA